MLISECVIAVLRHICQLYQDESKLLFDEMIMMCAFYLDNTMVSIFKMLLHWNNSTKGTHVAPLGPIFRTTNKRLCFYVLSGEAEDVTLIVVGLIQPWIELIVYRLHATITPQYMR